jgi:hypothetical protein
MYVDPAIDQVINERVMPPLAGHWAPQNALLWDGYRSISFPGEEIRLGAFAIYLDWSFEEVSAYVMSWSAVGALLKAEGPARIESALEAARAVWGDDRRRITMPLHLRVARIPGSVRSACG